MPIRIAKFIADTGVASRREAERLIVSGAVSVNGAPVITPVFFVNDGDTVTINGKILRIPNHESQTPKIIAFNKPVGTMTTARDPNGRKTIYDVLPKKYVHLKYIGRLDFNTSGLLLLTDSGDFARELTLPSSGIKRTYIAKLRPNPAKNARAVREFLSPLSADDSIFDPLRRGATIDGIHYAPMEIELLSRYPLSVKITLREGKKNEIRIAFEHIGLPVAKLKRIAYGPIELSDLPVGAVRELNADEVADLS